MFGIKLLSSKLLPYVAVVGLVLLVVFGAVKYGTVLQTNKQNVKTINTIERVNEAIRTSPTTPDDSREWLLRRKNN
jgi:hypothetical protein